MIEKSNSTSLALATIAILGQPPRSRNEQILSGFLAWRIFFVSVLFLTGILGIFFWGQLHGHSLEESRTYAVNTLMMMEVFYLFSVRYLRCSSLSFKRLFATKGRSSLR